MPLHVSLPKCKRLLENEYHNKLSEEKRIIHFMFSKQDGGVYDHPQNTEGIEKLWEVLRKYVTTFWLGCRITSKEQTAIGQD